MKAAADSFPSIIPGATIASRFRLEQPLGRGSMGSVWLAQHLSLNVPVAVKFIDAAFRDKDDHRSRFAVEARTAAKINSPHVVNILDFGSDDEGRLYIAMEYLQGEDLEHMLGRRGPLNTITTARILAHACHGLAKAHSLGVTHRDIKPENLFICGDQDGDDFVVKILDFGVAKAGQDIRQQFNGTRVGQLIGSPAYMSPEQARGAKATDYRSDLFSLGVVAYHCLTGCPPFPGEGLGELLMAIIDKSHAPVTSLNPELPPALNHWFDLALAKSPERRFQSAREMSEAYATAIGKSVTVSSSQDAYGSGLNASAPREIQNGRSSSFSASNLTQVRELSQALAPVAEVNGVLGVALLTGEGRCVAHYSTFGMQAGSFTDVLQAVRDAVDSFDAIDANQPQAMGLHFDNAVVLMRWIAGYPLLVIGLETVHPTVLSVSLNGAASKLTMLARQWGGPSEAFRTATSQRPEDNESGIVATVSLDDQVPEEVLAQVASVMTAELGPLARVGIRRLIKRDGPPTFREFYGFVDKLTLLAGDDREMRDRLRDAAQRLVPNLSGAQPTPTPILPPPAPPRQSASMQGTNVWHPAHAQAASEPSIEVGPAMDLSEVEASAEPQPSVVAKPPKPQPAKKKRTYVYRGKVYTVDD